MPRVTVAAVAIAVLIALTASGATALIVQRVLQGGTITARFEMWGILTGAWLEHPIAGFGPGSFPFILQTTGYFDTTSFAPRHPDSSVFQLFAVGLLGIAAAVAWVTPIAIGAMRATSIPARWAIVCFGVAALSTSATDFGFLVLVMLAWAAFVLPRSPSQVAHSKMQSHRAAVRIGQVLACAVIGAAFLSMTVAMYAYQDAREAVDGGHLGDAGSGPESRHLRRSRDGS